MDGFSQENRREECSLAMAEGRRTGFAGNKLVVAMMAVLAFWLPGLVMAQSPEKKADSTGAAIPQPCFSPSGFTAERLMELRRNLPARLADCRLKLADISKDFSVRLKGIAGFRAERIGKRLEMAVRLGNIIDGYLKQDDTDSLLFASRALKDFELLLSYFAEEKEHLSARTNVKEQTFSIRDFGAKGDGVTDDSGAFALALRKIEALNGAPTKLVLPPGCYRLSGSGAGSSPNRPGVPGQKQHLLLSGLRNFTLEGATPDTTLLFQQDFISGIGLMQDENVTLRNLILRFAPTFAEGEIIEVRKAVRKLRYRPVAGTLLPDDPRYGRNGRAVCPVFNSDGSFFSSSFFWPFGQYEKHDDGTYTLTLADGPIHWLRPGMKFVIPCRRDAAAVYMHSSRFCTVENLTIQNSWGLGFAYLRCYAGSFIGCRIVPEAGRSFSTNADGLHCPNNLIGPYLSRCEFLAMGDDPYNSYNKGYYLARTDKNTLLAFNSFAVGDEVSVVSVTTGQTLAESRVIAPAQGNIPWRKGKLNRITLADVLPDDIRTYDNLGVSQLNRSQAHAIHLNRESYTEPDLVFDYHLSGLATVISGCRFANNRNCGPVIQCSSFLLENTTIENMESYGVKIGAFTTWKEGPPPLNVLVRGCTFRNCGPLRTEFYVNRKMSPGRHGREISFVDNQVIDARSYAFSLECADGITLSGNLIGKPGKGAVYLGNVGGIVLKNNRLNDLPLKEADVVKGPHSGTVLFAGKEDGK